MRRAVETATAPPTLHWKAAFLVFSVDTGQMPLQVRDTCPLLSPDDSLAVSWPLAGRCHAGTVNPV